MKKPIDERETELVVGSLYQSWDGQSICQITSIKDQAVRWWDELGAGRSSIELFRRQYPKPAQIGIKQPLQRLADSNDDFTVRDEANALTAIAFRNGYIEELHAGKPSPLLEQPGYSRISNSEMRRLMIEASEMLARLLRLRKLDPEQYEEDMWRCGEMYCQKWERD